MKILLLGEYSNLHHTLSMALKDLGHQVVLISDGDGWKNYPRDINLRRLWLNPLGSVLYAAHLLYLLPKLKNFDVVQVINPIFIDMKPRHNQRLFDYLKRHNKCVSLGLFGDDTYVIDRMKDDQCLTYTDFYADGRTLDIPLNEHRRHLWHLPDRIAATRNAAASADCLVACLYEYYKVYDTPEFRPRLHYAPLPVSDISDSCPRHFSADRPVKILIGIQKLRGSIKGTDRMLPLLERLAATHPDRIVLDKVESVPFEQYCQMLNDTDVLVDQLYSFTPAMNALEAMKRGTIVVSGGEEEAYNFIGEHQLRPIINLRPLDDAANYRLLEQLLLDPIALQQKATDSIAYVKRHHDARLVAQRYLHIWQNLGSPAPQTPDCPD